MKSIKKISLVVLAAVLSITFANAQVGIQAGYSMSKIADKDVKAENGFHVGPIYNMSIQGPISLQYGLLYNMYINKSSESVTLPLIGTITGSSTHSMHQLDIPVRVAATFPLSSGVSAFAFAGPNFNIGLADNLKVAVNSKSTTTSLYENENHSRFQLTAWFRWWFSVQQYGLESKLRFWFT